MIPPETPTKRTKRSAAERAAEAEDRAAELRREAEEVELKATTDGAALLKARDLTFKAAECEDGERSDDATNLITAAHDALVAAIDELIVERRSSARAAQPEQRA